MAVEEGNAVFDSRDNCNAIINSRTNTLSFGCKNTVIPNTVKAIAPRSFFGCSGLTSITFPNSLEEIGSHAFYHCIGLTSATIPSSVKTIGEKNPFAYCTNLASISVDKENPSFDTRDNCNAVINTSTNELIIATRNSFIPSTVTSIGQGAFYYFSNYSFISIPQSVTTIKQSAFVGCSGLKEIDIPTSVTEIGVWAFQGCSRLINITIPDNVKTIGSLAFSVCGNPSFITIGKEVKDIGNRAFWLTKTSTITSLILAPIGINDDVFDVYDTATLYVPTNTRNVYQSTDGWKKFANIVELEDTGSIGQAGGKEPYAVLTQLLQE